MSEQYKDILEKLRTFQETEAEIAVETSNGIYMGTVKHIDSKNNILLLDNVTQVLGGGQRTKLIAPAIIPFEMIEDISIIT
jgi:hypothetical protein